MTVVLPEVWRIPPTFQSADHHSTNIRHVDPPPTQQYLVIGLKCNCFPGPGELVSHQFTTNQRYWFFFFFFNTYGQTLGVIMGDFNEGQLVHRTWAIWMSGEEGGGFEKTTRPQCWLVGFGRDEVPRWTATASRVLPTFGIAGAPQPLSYLYDSTSLHCWFVPFLLSFFFLHSPFLFSTFFFKAYFCFNFSDSDHFIHWLV